MEEMMWKFRWKTSQKKDTSIHWMSWERTSTPKTKGGMGFRNLRDFDIALLGKQGARMETRDSSKKIGE